MNITKVFADAVTDAQSGVNLINDGNNVDIYDAINKVLSAIFVALGIVAVIMIIYGGFLMTTSAGDAGKVKKGKDSITYGVIGLIVALLAGAIVNFVLSTLSNG